jgi:ATPases of the AAA+ class
MQTGEVLSSNTPIPVDRETSTPLAEVLFPPQLPDGLPILEDVLGAAVLNIAEEWRHAGMLADAGVAAIRSLLIYGPPGTGKTQLALWLAGELELPIVLARLDGLVSSFLGTTSRNIGALFSFASRYKCVLLLDEFDAIGKQRDDPHELGEIKRVVNTLLQNLDARAAVGFTIGVTNHEQLLDPAVWRRFEAQLFVPLPSFASRVAIVRRYMETVETSEAGARLLAWVTDGSTGADIEQLCKSLQKRVLMTSGAGNEYSLLNALQGFLPIHAGRLNRERVEAIQQPPEDLVPQLMADHSLGLSRADVAQLVGKDPTTISRWMQRAVSTTTNASRAK